MFEKMIRKDRVRVVIEPERKASEKDDVTGSGTELDKYKKEFVVPPPQGLVG